MSRSLIGVSLAAALLVFSSCMFVPPPLEEQKRQIDAGQFYGRILEPRAFLELWGEPTYLHTETAQFLRAPDGRYVPVFRLGMGEVPAGWDGSIVVESCQFMAYPERGELLGFVHDQLLYREQLSTQAIHAIAKKWQYEGQFKTRLEAPSKP
jgi:hypothetical protein